MNKSRLGIFLIVVMVSSIVLFSIANLSTAQFESGTNVNGVITSDTMWTQENSPYNLTGNLLVNNNVTLTIQPGTTVNINNFYIEINGTLQAIGNSSNQIYFNGGSISFAPTSNGWDESTDTGCIIDYSVLDSYLDVNCSAEIINNEINSGVQANAETTISNNTITDGVSAFGDAIITGNTISGQGIELYANATVVYNAIEGCSTGVEAFTQFWDPSNPNAWLNTTSLIENNLIINNGNGIEILAWQGSYPGNPIIQNNTITGNTDGIYVAEDLGAPSPTVIYNNIYGNNYNVKLAVSNNVNATYNWWGTTDASAINQAIYDYKDDFNLGTVTFAPFLTASNPEAPAYNQTPQPTPSPSQTSTPSPSPSPTPAPTSNQSPIDFYHDGAVNFRDIIYFVCAYIQYNQYGTLNPACDLNHDGKIDFTDIQLFVEDYTTYYSEALISVDSATQQFSSAHVGNTIQINITVSNVQDLWSWDIANLTFNPAMLNLTQVTEGPFLQQAGQTIFIWTSGSTQAFSKGYIPDMSDTLLSINSVNGSGVIATLTFTVLSLGTSQITFNQTTLLNSQPSQNLPPPQIGNPIGSTAINANITVGQ